MSDIELARAALAALKNSYSPCSGFIVGAALLAASGRVYKGCNIENASYPAGICAERAALSCAVSEGEREFIRLAVVGGRGGKVTGFCPPCGICRQTLAEFCGEKFEILLYNGAEIRKFSLGVLLPFGFGRNSLCE